MSWQEEEREDTPLAELVARVRDVEGWKEAVCRRHWLTDSGPSFFEVGRWVTDTTGFEPLTPLWSTREAAWKDAARRLG